jgi:hypothetical protein
MNYTYLFENMTLVVTCLLTGFIFGAILPMLLSLLFESIWRGLSAFFSNSYLVFTLFAVQVGFQLFLLQQWIFSYNKITSPGGPYDHLAYLPLTVVLPLFFFNILAGILSLGRFIDLDKR